MAVSRPPPVSAACTTTANKSEHYEEQGTQAIAKVGHNGQAR